MLKGTPPPKGFRGRPSPPSDANVEVMDWRDIKAGDVIWMTTSLFHQRIGKYRAVRQTIDQWWVLHDLVTGDDIHIKVKHNDTWRVLDE